MIARPASTLLVKRPNDSDFRADVLAGLAASPKRLSCKYFYDRRGSLLFDAICEQQEYYLTRTERQIMQEHVREMAAEMGEGVQLIEFGSGSSVKTRSLLNHLHRPAAYMPLDISRGHLLRTARRLRQDYPGLEIVPICGDFTDRFEVPAIRRTPQKRVVYFPGSTIGNFPHREAGRMLRRIADVCGSGGGLLIGIDLVKDAETIEAAYNDAAGVTAEFNLNLLLRINRELGGNFDLDAFKHQAFYDRQFSRVELRLVSLREQRVEIGGESFEFSRGEAIRTEYSHKYTLEGFAAMAAEAGWSVRRYWVDDRQFFGVLYCDTADQRVEELGGDRRPWPR